LILNPTKYKSIFILQALLYSFLGWNRCGKDIERFENCKKTGTPYDKDPTECYNEAKTLQQCYTA
jgi:hypothetical protein